ncbi:MAG: VCBS repeat-containing protein [Methanomassiliicoccales archaeon]|nr:MAG: VCBS repeat-containing protein [Methanomassiliicoccales archaeon]
MNLKISIVVVSVFLLLVPCMYSFPVGLDSSIKTSILEPIQKDEASKRSESPINSHIPTRAGGVTLTNVTPEVGLSGVTGDSFAWGDYNNDGYQDLLVKGGRLFRNNGPPNWDFTEVTDDVEITGSGYAVWGDYNNDGFLDFYAVGHPYEYWDSLWMNLGPPDYKFQNVTESAGNLDDGMPGLAAGWADYDRDGYLDLYIVNWRDGENIKYPDVLYHNNGDGTFTDVTVAAGVWEGDEPYAGMGMNWGDYNNDGWPDIHVSNYLVTPNYLYENNMDGTFSEVAHEKNAAGLAPAGGYYGHSAGSSWADYDHDGDLDMWVSNLAHTTDPRGFYTDYSQMLRNDGAAAGYSFTDVRDDTGIEKKPYMSEDELHFGIAWGDYDNDGDYDMFIPQVKDIDYAFSYFFENNGDGTFTDVSEEVGVKVWNTDGACWVDYNNDGYIDLTVEGQYPFGGNREIRLFRNNAESGYKWLEVELKASFSNFASIGARVMVSYNGITMMKEVEGGTAGHSYQHSLIQHFGFGDYDGTVDVEVWWPSGRQIVWEDIALNQKVTIREYDYDLIVSSISFSNPEPGVGDSVTINAIIQNVGNSEITSAKIKFFEGDVGSDLIGSKHIYDISPGNEKTAQVQWDTSGKGGSHIISVIIEEVQPQEENNQNNQDEKEITVKVPDLMVSQISVSNPQPEVGETVTIFAEIKNSGDLEAVSATVKFFIDDISTTPIGIHHLNNIASGAKNITQEKWDTAGKKGIHTIIVQIEDIEPEDYDINNNNGTRNIEVKDKETQKQDETNSPPVITAFSAEPSSIKIGESCTLTVVAEDSDDDQLTYTYQASDGFITGIGSVVVWYAPDKAGDFNITVTVKDSRDGEDTESVIVEVQANKPPQAKSAMTSTENVYNNGFDRVLITVEITDENGLNDIKLVRIDLSEIGGSSKQRMYDDGTSGDKKVGDGIYTFEAVIPEGVEPGQKNMKITAIDKSGGENTIDVQITVLSTEEKDDDDMFSWPFAFFPFLAIIAVLAIIVITAIVLVRRRGKRNRVEYR